MEWFEILIIILAASFVFVVIFLNTYLKKKKGVSINGGCCGNCIKCSKLCENKKGHSLIEEYHKSEQ